MTIKKSLLEGLWYYRLTKVFLLTLPFIAVLIAILYGDLREGDKIASVLIFTTIGWFVYAAVLNGVWKLVLYIIYGGLEDDVKKKPVTAQQPPAVQPQQAQQNKNSGTAVIIIIVLILAVFLIAYAASQ